MSIDLTTLSTREVLSAVYIGYYNRAADPAGIQFWEQVIANTSLDLEAVATDFAGQSETLAAHPFFADPATSTPATFIANLYQNLFNRDADAAGLEFWSGQLQNAIDGVEGSFSVGEIIVKIIEGAVDVDGGTQDRTTILNKIEVAQDWTDAAEADGRAFDAAAMTSAKEIIADVTSDAATVAAAKATTDAFFAPVPVEGETILLTSATDVETGTADNDTFNAYIQQNPFAGGISNSLSSADRLDGGAGDDRLYAELTSEFLGTSGNGVDYTDVQPRLKNIEEIDIEARDYGDGSGQEIVVDGKNITDHVEIGSYFSDGDLKIENLTTLTAGGNARNTSDITVTMDHTDNFNTDGDASDLEVLFDNDYLLSGQESEGQVFYHLLDEDAELAGLSDRLDNIDVDGIRFNITNADGSVTMVTLNDAAAQTAGTHQGFVDALQSALQALIADGTLPAGTTLTLDPTNVDDTFLDDGSRSADIPAITLITGDGSSVVATGFSRVADAIGEYDVYGRFGEVNETADQPISIDVDLHKVGRGGHGGDLVVGGKASNVEPGIAGGIEVFNIDVLGAGIEDPDGGANKPSSLGTVTSTLGALETVNIATHADFVAGSTHASLEVRDGFNADGSSTESGDLKRVDASAFLGDLALGTNEDIINADTVLANGGGDVNFNGAYNGSEDGQAYAVTTGSGNDSFDINIDGDAVDAVGESFSINMGDGDNSATLSVTDDLPSGTGSTSATNSDGSDANGVSPETTNLLMNLTATAGSGADSVEVQGMGTWDIETNAGSDFVFINSGGAKGSSDIWNDTGASQFSPVVVYKAELAISYAGFESVIDIDTGDNFILTEAELNAHIIEAIKASPELSKLISAATGTGNQDLQISALIDGLNELGIQIRQPELLATGPVAAGSAQVVLNSSDVAGMTRDLVAVGSALDGTAVADSTPVDTAAEIVALYGDANTPTGLPATLETTDALITDDDLFGNTDGADGYTGQVGTYEVDFDTAAAGNTVATVGTVANDSKINVGTGTNDIAVLSANGGDTATTSQNTLIFDDLNAGKVSIVNWFDAATTADLLTNGHQVPTTQVNGDHLLDFTAFLTTKESSSGSSDSATSVLIEATDDSGGNIALSSNSMNFTTVDQLETYAGSPTAGYSLSSLSASDIKALIEDGAAGGNITYAAETVGGAGNLLTGTTARTSIIAVENIDVETGAGVLDNTNHGEYKFFQVIYGVDAEGNDSTVTVNEITTADFGDSINLVGLAANEADNLVGGA